MSGRRSKLAKAGWIYTLAGPVKPFILGLREKSCFVAIPAWICASFDIFNPLKAELKAPGRLAFL